MKSPCWYAKALGALVSVVICATVTPICPAQDWKPKNIITNGGFEQGFVGWQPAPEHELVTDARLAHSGNNCVSGEVAAPNRALQLRRTISVQKKNRYVFEVWAKATGRTKLVLWVVQPGLQQRKLVAAWENLPNRWVKCSTPLPAEADGQMELQIIAPSSHNAPPGKIWLDDIAVWETTLPASLAVSESKYFCDEPVMAVAADGSIYVAWNSFRNGHDTLQVARYRLHGDGFEKLGQWQVFGGKNQYLLGPVLAPLDNKVALAFAAEVAKRWDIYVLVCGPNGPEGKLVPVTSDQAVDCDPAIACHNGAIWVAWESNRNGYRQIFACQVTKQSAGPAVAVSSAGYSSYDPTVAVLANGELCVAWHSFRNNNYDIYLRRRLPDGSWQPERRLTRSPLIDRHAELFANGHELWLVYESARVQDYHIGATNFRRLLVAKVTPNGLLSPKDPSPKCPLLGRCEAGSLSFDQQGRIWLAMLRPRLPRAGWDTFLTFYAEGKWQPPQPISAGKGMDRRPQLAILDNTAVLAYQNDTIPNSWADVDKTKDATSEIYLAAVKLPAQPASTNLTMAPLEEPSESFPPAQLRVEHGEDLPTPQIEYNGKTLYLFFGDLHEHTDVSVCNRLGDQSIDESYQHMRDIARYDFACTTDHGYNLSPYFWNYTAKLARVNDDPGRFLTFLAEEWTSSFEKYSEEHPYGYYGHRNLILADVYFPRWWNARNGQTPAEVWEELRQMNANFVHIPHQLADTGNVPTDWNYVDEVAQPVAEIFQVRGSYEYKGAPREAKRSTPEPGYFLQDAWARGIVIGVIASPDHGGGYGKACVYAPELTREAILEALRQRHCYGTTAAKIFLDVRINGHLMGEKVRGSVPRTVEVVVRTKCPGEIARIDICRNNRFIYTANPSGKEATLRYVDRDPPRDRAYYYVRVIQTNDEIAWSSPVWFGVP